MSRDAKGAQAEFPVDLIERADEAGDMSKRTLEKLAKFLPVQKEFAEQRREEALHSLREQYIGRSFGLVKMVLLVSLLFVAVAGAGWWSLSDAVLIALLTTTTANVIGILAIAFHWLFPKK